MLSDLLRSPHPLLLPIALALVALLPIWVAPAQAAPSRVAAPEIVPFEDWAPKACPRPTGEDPAPTRRTVVHHTHEPVAHTPEDVRPALALTCAAHVGRGFSTIGYHYVVDPWGGIWQGRGGMPDGKGRAPKKQAEGAHVAGSNSGAVGVVFLGDHAAAPPTAAALESATQLLAWLMDGAKGNPNGKVKSSSTGGGTARFAGTFVTLGVDGHSASNTTECPGEHLEALLGELRTRVAQVMSGKAPSSWDGLAAAPAPSWTTAAPARAKAVRAAPAKAAADTATKDGKAAAPAAQTASASASGTKAADKALRKADAATKVEPAAVAPAPPPDAPGLEGPVALPNQRLAQDLHRLGLPALAEQLARDPLA